MKHYTEEDDLYLKPKMFDRWKLYVSMRKLIRYHLTNMSNKLKPIKSDLSIAFNRWKLSISERYNFLKGTDRLILVDKAIEGDARLKKLK
jgi:hypothetical protein